ncbi:hypothetical protein MicB006_4325 [Micromonospora sp. B006]|nr:hypothetical protein MicB006_4325 [Micromonospora sp. B006]
MPFSPAPILPLPLPGRLPAALAHVVTVMERIRRYALAREPEKIWDTGN